MKHISSLGMGMVSLLGLLFLAGCEPCRETLEQQAAQHKAALAEKRIEWERFAAGVQGVLGGEVARGLA